MILVLILGPYFCQQFFLRHPAISEFVRYSYCLSMFVLVVLSTCVKGLVFVIAFAFVFVVFCRYVRKTFVCPYICLCLSLIFIVLLNT